MKKKIIALLLLLVNIFLLSGCWNYKDIETVSIVAGVAIDKDVQSNEYILTIELIDQQLEQNDTQATKSEIIEARGVTISDAISNGAIIAGKKLLWSHSKIIIVSEDIAEEGIIPALDWFMRNTEVRSDIWVAISKADTAGQILKTPIEANAIVSFYLSDTFDSSKYLAEYIPSELITFIQDMTDKKISVLAPCINIVTRNDKNTLEICDTCVFKQDKMVYSINSDEAKAVLIIKDKLKGGLLILDKTKDDSEIKITMEILNCKTKIKPVLKNDKIIIKIEAKMELGFAEIEGNEDYTSKDQRKTLQKDIEKIVSEQMKDLLSRTQDNSSTDVFDFSGTIQRKMPDYWKEIKDDWDEIYKSIEIQPDIEIEITYSGYTQKPIEIGD